MASPQFAEHINTLSNRYRSGSYVPPYMGTPSIILGAGSAGVGKTTVFKDIAQDIPELFLLEKDAQLEAFMWSNPFERRTPKLELPANERISFSSDTYKNTLRDQVYASVFEQAYRNTLLGKSTVADANYIGWLKDPQGRISLALSMTHFFNDHLKLREEYDVTADPCEAGSDRLRDPFSEFRMPIIFFYVTDPDVVKHRLLHRMETSQAYADQDRGKFYNEKGELDNAVWEKQLAKEPVTWFPELDLYADLLGVDMTKSYLGTSGMAQRLGVREQIFDFLSKPETLRSTGIFKGESLDTTMKRFSTP